MQSQGIAAWVDAQLATPTTGYAALGFIDPNSAIGCPTGSAATCYRDNYTAFPVQLQFYRNALTGADQLRQRVALAYSQIFVISNVDIKPAYGVRAYQQMLLDNAFVNYRQLIERVTLHPAMGDYLDMVNNDKPSATVQANENYAREVLQLFSIGLVKLNTDGTSMKDANGVGDPDLRSVGRLGLRTRVHRLDLRAAHGRHVQVDQSGQLSRPTWWRSTRITTRPRRPCSTARCWHRARPRPRTCPTRSTRSTTTRTSASTSGGN